MSSGESNRPLGGQHAFITGGGSGIGLGAAKALLVDGASVTIAGRSAERLETARLELNNFTQVGSTIDTAVVDVSDEVSLERGLHAANDRVPLTIAVANAGVGSASPLLSTELTDWERVLRTNLTGAFLTFKCAGRHLVSNGGGVLCAVSSIAGNRTHRFMSAYTASKAGLEMLVKNAADELGPHRVRVNAIAPGIVDTDISASLRENEAVNDDYRQNMPLGRRGTTEDTSAAIRFLCGPESSWVTGVILPVDGGHHLRRGPNLAPLLAGRSADEPPASQDPGDRSVHQEAAQNYSHKNKPLTREIIAELILERLAHGEVLRRAELIDHARAVHVARGGTPSQRPSIVKDGKRALHSLATSGSITEGPEIGQWMLRVDPSSDQR